ncbi:MAG: Histidyl-tRNA synthetase [Candidatus Carbobacillus altaicus]|uniref:Histidine--tRNA ligase n=1 Tax=Candidatus Carbonibacillus altaicus TaxID=2163959 RepID=A0A2R6XXV3_9BACL|nr:MAG: Histidyl-tRNA synthetase [Candidatus Carbobacillus altaicus]
MQVLRGMVDILPAEARRWQWIEAVFRETASRFGYGEIRTPLLEHAELYERSVGDTTDIVQKEMYVFDDRGGRTVALRPEGTAGVVRAFVEHKLYGRETLPLKLFYMGPMFRYERPQSGRQRQFHQFGVEALGSDDPFLDAEIISLAWFFLQSIGLDTVELHLGSIGCPGCRLRYRERLIRHLLPHRDELCEDCRRRLDTNPLRILDCKIDGDKPFVRSAPTILDDLCDDCKTHFTQVQTALDALGVPYTIDPHLARGLDYYTKTVFEFIDTRIGAKSTVLAGGRYNGLVKELGGPDLPGIGFAAGVERLMLLLEKKAVPSGAAAAFDVVVSGFGTGQDVAWKLLFALREAGVRAEWSFDQKKLKAVLRDADRAGARYVVLVGDDETVRGEVTLKDLKSGEQTTFSQETLVERLKTLLS